MSTAPNTSSTLLAEWAALERLPDVPAGPVRQLAVHLDRSRIRLSENPDGTIVIESRIKDLPLAPGDRDSVLRQAMKVATARIQYSNTVLAADEAGAGLYLQRCLTSGSSAAEVSAAVEQLANEVDMWRASA